MAKEQKSDSTRESFFAPKIQNPFYDLCQLMYHKWSEACRKVEEEGESYSSSFFSIDSEFILYLKNSLIKFNHWKKKIMNKFVTKNQSHIIYGYDKRGKLIIKSIDLGCLINTVCFEVVSYWINFSSLY